MATPNSTSATLPRKTGRQPNGLPRGHESRLFFRLCRFGRIGYRRTNYFAAAWVTQRQQANVQWLLQEKTRRQELYQEFIEEASKLYVDALTHDQTAIPPLVSLYASVNKMRVVSRPDVAELADKLARMIVDTYFLPNKTLPELRAMIESGALDFLRDFSEACRKELDALTPSVFSYRSTRGSRGRVN
jgi:hypothetical protein